MRARLLGSSLVIALIAVLLLGIPFTVVGTRLLGEEAQARLARDADAVAAAIEDGVERGELPTAGRLAALVPAGRFVRVAGAGRSVAAGPSAGPDALEATTTIGDVRVTVAEPADAVDDRVHALWLLVGAAGAGGLLAAAALAAWQARRLAKPLERLAEVSERLGRGDLGVRAGPQEVREIDAVATALDRSAEEIARLVERERAFSSNVAHQLRTPLTALDMRLEELAAHDDPAVREEAQAALAQTERLRRTTDDLLALARHGGAGELGPLDVGGLLDDRVSAWAPVVTGRGRRLLRSGSQGAVAHASRAAVEQAVDVLIENALRHGLGDIDVSVEETQGFVHVGVRDQGAGLADDVAAHAFAPRLGGGGIGLSLARAMVEAGGGRLTLRSPRPPLFEIVVPSRPT